MKKYSWILVLLGLVITFIGIVTKKFIFLFLLLPLGYFIKKNDDA